MLILDSRLAKQVEAQQLKLALVELKQYIREQMRGLLESRDELDVRSRAYREDYTVHLSNRDHLAFTKQYSTSDGIISQYLTNEQVKCFVKAHAERIEKEYHAST